MFGKFKRVIAVISVAALMLSFSACGNKKEANSGNVTEVKVWSESRGSKAVMLDLVNEWNSTVGKEKGIKIVYEVLTGNAGQQVEVALQSGTAADIIGSSDMKKRVALGYLQPIDELEGGKEFLESFSSRRSLANCMVGDHYYTVPASSIVGGLLYNKDLFKEAGLVDKNGEPTPPETYEELREYAKKLTNPSKKQYGIIFPGKATGVWYSYEIKWPMMSSVGHDGFNPETNQYDFTGLKPIMETLMDIKNDGSCYPGTESIDADPARARFAEGTVGMKFGISWDVGVLTDQFPAKCDWGVAPLPVLDKDNCYKQKMEVYNGFSIVKIPEGKDADKIFEAYKFIASDEVRVALFEEGVALPWDASIIEKADTKNIPSQWKEFADLISISTAPPLAITTDTTGETSLDALFVSEVWNGSKDNISKILNEWTKVSNNGIKLYRERNPEYDPSAVDNSSFNPAR